MILSVVGLIVCLVVVALSVMGLIMCRKNKYKKMIKVVSCIGAGLGVIGAIFSGAGMSTCEMSQTSSANIFSCISIGVFLGEGSNDSQTIQGVESRPTETAFETVDRYVVGWGDNTGGRRAYTIDEINNGDLGTKIVLNSISDGTIGHEFNFVGARRSGDKGYWSGNVIEAEEGEEYRVRIYVHNNNPGAYDAIAKDVSIRFSFPSPVKVTGDDIDLEGFDSSNGYCAEAIHGFISVSNGTPSEYWDGVKFVSNRPFHLEYVNGSAICENQGIGSGGYSLSDDIVRDYIKIGYDEMNGEIPGCFEYASYTTILVKPVFDD